MAADTEIAIVGVGCRFPGADDLQGFWTVLKNGENHIVDIPKDRWDIDSFYDADPNAAGKSYVKKAGLIKSFERWDNHFFGINDVEATRIDPQQRLVLDCVHMALENGGFTRKEINGSLTGVYIGAMNDDYSSTVMGDTSPNNYTVTGTHRSIISARVSYVYNLQGPAMSIDTACSSSLVAINVASQALKLGECNMAVCGGVNYLMDPNLFVALSKARMLSPTGQCQTFSVDADGYARGEGCGIVILKRLEDALRDHNEIWGTINVATNQDGHVASPITAPSGLQQMALLEHVYTNNQTDKNCIQVIEAHGTGTPVGDPVEANALGRYFKGSGKTVYIGSVKTNIGHLESAAGVAGLIKILLMMKYKTIVPSLMYRPENENPKLNLDLYGLKVPTACTIWEQKTGKCRMGCVNSFGFGGTNAHVIVKEHLYEINHQQPSTDGKQCASLVVLSADNATSLVDNIKHLKKRLECEDVDVMSLAFTSQFKRDHMRFRKTFSAHTIESLLSTLSQFSDKDNQFNQSRTAYPVNFVFCGVGTTWTGMGKEMMTYSIFSHTIGEIDCHLKELTGWSIGDRFLEGFRFTEDPMSNHIAIFAYQVGLDALWKAAGIRPNAVLGQSVGEVAAAYSAGCLDLKSATQIIFYRSKFLANVKTGKMVVVKNVDVAEIESFCKGKEVAVAVSNSNTSCTLAGDANEIEDTCRFIKEEHDSGVLIQLDVPCAYHSDHVEGAAQALKMQVNKLYMHSNKMQTHFYSTVTGRQEDSNTISSADYWQKNVRMQVKFGETVGQSASENEFIIFLEIGPAPVLRAHLQDIIDKKKTKNAIAVPSVTRNSEMDTFVGTLGKLFEHGANPTWDVLFPSQAKLSSLPTYVFRDKHCPLYRATDRSQESTGTTKKHLFMDIFRQENGDTGFCINIHPVQTSFVFDHRVKDKVVVPGAMYADTAFFLGNTALNITDTHAEISLDFLSPMMLSENTTSALHVIVRPIEPRELEFVIKSGSIAKCKGRVRQKPYCGSTEGNVVGIDEIESRICRKNSIYFSKEKIYNLLAGFGFQYGHCFCMLQGGVATDEEGLIDVRVPDAVMKEVDQTFIHPCILDSALQSCFFGFTNGASMRNTMPASIGAIHLYTKLERNLKMHARKTAVTSLETTFQVHFDVTAYSTNRERVFHLENFTLFVRKAGYKVPVELQYTLSLRQLENGTPAKTQLKTLIVITDETNPNVIQKLKSAEHVRSVKMLSSSRLNVTELDEIHENDVIVVLLQSYNPEGEDRSSAYIYNRIRDNCWKLAEILRSLEAHAQIIPLTIVTQNAHLITPDNSNTYISILGPEVWGFIRSVHTEFVIKDLTLVDLQPSVENTLDTFISFVANKSNDHMQPKEIIIRNNEILQLELNRLPKSTICPKVRVSSIDKASSKKTFVYIPDGGNATVPYTAIASPNQQPYTMDTQIGMTEILVQTVYQYPPGLFVNRPEYVDDSRLHGIEYTAIPERHGREEFSKCKCDSVASCDVCNIDEQDRLVVVFPASIQPRMNVPEKCVIRSRSIPFYRPGIFVYGLIFWEMTKHVHEGSIISIISEDLDGFDLLLKYMLETTAKHSVVDDTTCDSVTDVIILLSRKDKVLKNIWQAKHVITLPNTLSLSQKSQLTNCGSNLIEIGFEEVLSNNMVPKHLKDVTGWMKKNEKKFSSRILQSVTLPSQIHIAAGLNFLLDNKRHQDDLFEKDATYLVTGGLTGLGWELVQLIVEMGAKQVCTMSRRSPNQEQIKNIEALSKKYFCDVVHFQANVSELHSVQNAISQIENKLGKLKGIFHCAGVLDSRVVIRLDLVAIENVLKPKVLGALNLHYATKHMHIDYFVLASSIASLLGMPGQSNYGAANNFLDAFAISLRQRGFAGQSIRWGALDLGMVKDNNMETSMKRWGHRLMSVPEIKSCFRFQMMANSTGVVCADLDWDLIAFDHTNKQMQNVIHKIRNCMEENVTKNTAEDSNIDTLRLDVDKIQTAGRDVQLAAVQEFIITAACRIIHDDSGDLTITSNLTEVGLDSMSLITLGNVIYDVTRCRIPFELLNESETTFMFLAGYIQSELFAGEN